MKLVKMLLLAAVATALATEDSCLDRCEDGYDLKASCQCDSMCAYYESCCTDYESVCRDRMRGDTFAYADDEDYDEELDPVVMPLVGRKLAHSSTQPPIITQPDLKTSEPSFPAEATVTITTSTTDAMELTANTTETSDPDADACSGRAFDSFVQLKNGSTYAFRGSFFFELGEKAVLPGYPKRIEDVWGIFGPIDAAFTRINCQGKTYIFKGDIYWRFEGNVLDEDYPRNISDGFENIPDNVDAAFAVPAKNHHGREKVYFFKGDQYYQYEFKQQPTHEECVELNARSPSTLFGSYTDMFSSTWEGAFSRLFSGNKNHGQGLGSAPPLISRNWLGVQAPVDAVLAGRLYISHGHRGKSRRRQKTNSKQDWDQQGIHHRDWGQQDRGQQDWGQRDRRQQDWGQRDRRQQDRRQQDWGQQDWGQRDRGQQDWGQQDWGQRSWQKRSPQWSMNEWDVSVGQGFMERIYREETRRQDWDGGRTLDWDQQRRISGHHSQQQNYNSRYSINNRLVQKVYFFKKDQYYRVDLQSMMVDLAHPPYPRSTAKYWLGCQKAPRAEKR